MDFQKENIINELANDRSFAQIVSDNHLTSEDLARNIGLIVSYKFKRDNCLNCTSLDSCTSSYKGMCPVLKYSGRFVLDYVPCKYQAEVNHDRDIKNRLVTLCCNLDNVSTSDLFNDKIQRKELYREVKNICTSLDRGETPKGLFVSGPYGCGKSYVIGALCKNLATKGYSCVFAYYPDLVREIKSSIATNSLSDYVDTLKNCDVLVLDDFGGEASSSFIRDEVLGAVLQYRMEEHLLTFMTSNLDKKTLHTHLAESKTDIDDLKAGRIEERINSLMTYISLTDKSYRN